MTGGRGRPCHKHRFGRAEEQRVALAVRDERRLAVRLSKAGHEAQWKLAVGDKGPSAVVVPRGSPLRHTKKRCNSEERQRRSTSTRRELPCRYTIHAAGLSANRSRWSRNTRRVIHGRGRWPMSGGDAKRGAPKRIFAAPPNEGRADGRGDRRRRKPFRKEPLSPLSETVRPRPPPSASVVQSVQGVTIPLMAAPGSGLHWVVVNLTVACG